MKKLDIMGSLKPALMVGAGAVGATRLVNEICKDYVPANETAKTEAKGISPTIAAIGLIVAGTFAPALIGKKAAKFSEVFSGIISAGAIKLGEVTELTKVSGIYGIGAYDFPLPDRRYNPDNNIAGLNEDGGLV